MCSFLISSFKIKKLNHIKLNSLILTIKRNSLIKKKVQMKIYIYIYIYIYGIYLFLSYLFIFITFQLYNDNSR